MQRSLLIALLFVSACTGWRPADERRDGSTGCYPADARDVVTIDDHILRDLVLSCEHVYLFPDQINVDDDATLTIQPGAVLRFAERAALIVKRGSHIRAVGTREDPIVFTSELPTGHWVGVAFAGRAPVHTGGDLTQGAPYEEDLRYGGTEADYDCGTMQYVRIERGGGQYDGASMGALALEGCGTGTTIDHLQIHAADFEGLEVDGGTVRLNHIAITDAGDEAVRVEDGWRGGIQHLLVHAWRPRALAVELDNDSENFDITPRTQAYFVNATFIGNATRGEAAITGVEWSTGAGGIISNTIIAGWRTAIDVDEPSWEGVPDRVRVERTYFWDNEAIDLADDEDDGAVNLDEEAEIALAGEGNRMADPELSMPYEPGASSYEPTSDEVESVGCAPDGAVAPSLDRACYAGAFERGGDAWMEGWTAFP